MNDMSEHLLKCYMYSSKVFARSAIHWIPEVLSARHAFVTEIGPARLTEYKTMSTLNLQPILCENAFLFVLFLSRWDFVRFGQSCTKYFTKYLCGCCTKYS